MLLVTTKSQLGKIQHQQDTLGYRKVLKEGFLLAGINFLWLVYFRIDTILLGILKDDLAVGLYNVAYRIIEGIIFVPGIIMIVFFPQLARPDNFKKIFLKLSAILVSLGIVTTFVLYFSSAVLIEKVYGAEYLSSIAVLQILALALFPIFIGHLATQALVALDRSKLYLLATFLGTLVNTLLNILIIPVHGAIGAAWATFVTEILVVTICCYFIWRHFYTGEQ